VSSSFLRSVHFVLLRGFSLEFFFLFSSRGRERNRFLERIAMQSFFGSISVKTNDEGERENE